MQTDYFTVPLTQGFVAIVDIDQEWVLSRKWFVSGAKSGHPYAVTGASAHRLIMHREILGDACIGLVVDHLNGNTLDNRRSNIRAVSSSQNSHNVKVFRHSKSGVMGVIRDWRRDGWVASIRVSGKRKWLGSFASLEDAARARALAEIEYWGVEPRRAEELSRFRP